MIEGILYYRDRYSAEGDADFAGHELLLPVRHKDGRRGRKQDDLAETVAFIYEADDLTLAEQQRVINDAIKRGYKKNILSIVFSGKKSYHILIRADVDCNAYEHKALWHIIGRQVFGDDIEAMDTHGATLNALTRSPWGVRVVNNQKVYQKCIYANDSAEVFDCSKELLTIRIQEELRATDPRFVYEDDEKNTEYCPLTHIQALYRKYGRENYRIAIDLLEGRDAGVAVNLKGVLACLWGSGVRDIGTLCTIATQQNKLHPTNTGIKSAAAMLTEITGIEVTL